MAAKRQSDICAYFGPQGSGKTSAMLHDNRSRRAFLRLDMNGQASMAAGADRIVHTRAELVEALLDGTRKLCWRMERGNPFYNFAFACRVSAAADGLITLMADEADSMIPHSLNMVTTKARDPALENALQHIGDVLKRGRHNKVDFRYTSLYPSNVNPGLRSDTHTFFVFRSSEPAYGDFVKRRAGPEALEAFHSLKPYSCLEISGGDWKIRPPAKIS